MRTIILKAFVLLSLINCTREYEHIYIDYGLTSPPVRITFDYEPEPRWGKYSAHIEQKRTQRRTLWSQLVSETTLDKATLLPYYRIILHHLDTQYKLNFIYAKTEGLNFYYTSRQSLDCSLKRQFRRWFKHTWRSEADGKLANLRGTIYYTTRLDHQLEALRTLLQRTRSGDLVTLVRIDGAFQKRVTPVTSADYPAPEHALTQAIATLEDRVRTVRNNFKTQCNQ